MFECIMAESLGHNILLLEEYFITKHNCTSNECMNE